MAVIMGPDASTAPSTVTHKDVLESAAKLVDTQMQIDNSYPKLLDNLKMGGASFPTISGLNDQDYPGLSELSISFHLLSQLSAEKRIPLPPELVEQFSLMQSNCQMGLFPEISRAWLTIDSNIFIWSYEDGSDLAYFNGLKETVLSVGLVKPKGGVFQPDILYLLCLTTPVEIVILGVTFAQYSEESSVFEEMSLLSEPIFSYPTDNVHMCTFQGTDNGRIFLGGKDGSLYEFSYQAQDRWFHKKCRKINHSSNALSFLVPSFLTLAFSEDDAILQIAVDNSRHILYARFEKGSIQVFDLGVNGDEMSKVTVVHQQTIVQQASDIAHSMERKYFYPIVHISAIEATESLHVHLVAVTRDGVRLYFTTSSGMGDLRPYTLTLLHVRLPPGFTGNASVPRPSMVNMAYYKKGLLLLASSQTEDNDVIFSTSSDSFVIFSQLVETHATVVLDGRAWALAEVIDRSQPKYDVKKPLQKPEIVCDPPALVTQHREEPRKFVFLSAQGSFIFRKPRPVDQLCKLLIDNKGPDSDFVKAFFMIHKDAQACAMCLILACSQKYHQKQVAEWATRAFFMYGGEAKSGLLQAGDAPISTPESQMSLNRISTPFSSVWTSTPQHQQSFPANLPQPQFSNVFSPVRPVQSAVTSSPATSLPSQQLSATGIQSTLSFEVYYSGRHNGLYLYFSRIIRPLWNMKLVSETTVIFQDSTVTFITSNIKSKNVSTFLLELVALKKFFQDNQKFFLNPTVVGLSKSLSNTVIPAKSVSSFPTDTSSVYALSQQSTQGSKEADQKERISMGHFQHLLNYTHEMLALWKVLCDHQFESVVALLPQEHQDQLKQMTFKDFIIDGKELSTSLTNALINFYLEDNANTGTISQHLRTLCPTIYKIEDATMSRAHEIVLKAKLILNKEEKEKELMEALKLCKSISPNLDLAMITGLFQGAGFYYGIVDLCLCCAHQRDPQGVALHYYRNGEPPDDQQGMQAFIRRMKCYRHIIDAISDLMHQGMLHPQSPSVPKAPGPPSTKDPHALTPEKAKVLSEETFDMALKCGDELFHVALYDWLIDNNKTDVLLSIQSHFLENYLKRCSTIRPDNFFVLDLLWKYYKKNQNYSAAARVLDKLAVKHGGDMNLSRRMEYLSRAIMCVKSSEMRISSTNEGEFLNDLEEKMEVARIQLRILDALQRKKLPNSQEAISNLNSNFHDITMLYQDFAVKFDLAECKLAILHCSGHHDPALIESIWQSILNKEITNSVGNLPDIRVKILQERLVSISQAYVTSEKYFPLAFLIKQLELKTCPLNFDPSWVFQTMLSLDVSVVELLSVYHKLYHSKDSSWSAVGKSLHLYFVLVLLIEHFANNPSSVPINERRSFRTHCLDLVSEYLVDLQAMDSAIRDVPTLIQDFRSVQYKLERLP